MNETEIGNLAISFLGGRSMTNMATETSQQAIACRKWFDPARDEALKSHPWNFAAARHRATTAWQSVIGAADNGGGLIRITSAAHGLSTGRRVAIKDVGGVPNSTGRWYVTVIDVDTYDLQDSTFAGSYTSGGLAVEVPVFGWQWFFALPSGWLAVRTVNGREANEEDSTEYEIEGDRILMDESTLELRYTFQQDDTTQWTQDFINLFALLLASYIAQDLTGPAGKAADLRNQYEALKREVKARDAQQGKGRRLAPGWDCQAIRARSGFYGPHT